MPACVIAGTSDRVVTDAVAGDDAQPRSGRATADAGVRARVTLERV